MRSKYLEKIIQFTLSIMFYVFLVPGLVFVSDWLGLGRNIFVFLIVYVFSFILVYAVVSIGVGYLFRRVNDNIRMLRRAHGGRDIASEERHEGEGDLLSLFPDER